MPASLVLLLVVRARGAGCRSAARCSAARCYATGSAEAAAYMSGVQIGRSKLAAYTLAGFSPRSAACS